MSFVKLRGKSVERFCIDALRAVAAAKFQHGDPSQQLTDAKALLDHFCDHLFVADFMDPVDEDGVIGTKTEIPIDSERLIARLQRAKARHDAAVASGAMTQSDYLEAMKKRNG